MQQALSGFAVIWMVIALGWLLAHLGIVTESGQAFLSKIAFLVASPALLFSLVAQGSLAHLFSMTLLASCAAIAAAGGLYLLANRLFFRTGLASSTVGTLAACYTNAGNLGLPIAQHVLGDMSWMAPILLLQVGLLQPTALALLDVATARADGVRLSPWRYLTLPVRNPITVGILLGLAVNLAQIGLPDWLTSSVSMVGGMAVPMMLIAFGVSLRLEPLPGTGPHARELWTIQLIKVVVMPLVAFAAGRLFGLDAHQLFAVAVIAALPTAQNVFVISSRYRAGERIARDGVFWSTILTVPSILAISLLLG